MLVVEDDPLTHTSIIKMLEALGLTVLGSRSGRIGLDILERHPDISLLICDIMMDGMDGRTLIKRIRAMPDYEALPILIVSGIVSRAEVNDLLSLGPGDFLEKPIGAQTFKAKVKDLLTMSERSSEGTSDGTESAGTESPEGKTPAH